MPRLTRTIAARLVLVHLALFGLLAAGFPDPPGERLAPAAGTTEKVVLAGGCFWGVEAVFESLKGVHSAVSGYAGGSKLTAHYDIVSTGMTGHAESVEVTYDPAQISFGRLLKVYFSVAHDPTQLNRQGPDSGSQYRSEIFYTSDAQKRLAQAYMKDLAASKVFAAPIVTKLEPLRAFYAAEDYHQHFLVKNPTYPYIVYNDLPKLEQLRKDYPGLLKGHT